jgi:hypothetical protein
VCASVVGDICPPVRSSKASEAMVP